MDVTKVFQSHPRTMVKTKVGKIIKMVKAKVEKTIKLVKAKVEKTIIKFKMGQTIRAAAINNRPPPVLSAPRALAAAEFSTAPLAAPAPAFVTLQIVVIVLGDHSHCAD
uniref:Uncharacterized protein n=1 Tax=Cacopsylla melanoneura TaxID=428564 RepID=A0A8D8Z7V1_9HEMI